ncbi:MAG: DUF1549 domain-containing protein [Phycisphaera sp.]|nr:DUF1549 domain-containing protein [Phycisphaera sp.]
MLLWCIATIVVGLGAATTTARAQETERDLLSRLPKPAEKKIDFIRDVQPLFKERCFKCHGPEKHKSDYRLDRKADALEGGSIGEAITAGNSATSMLIHYVAGLDEDMIMPPKGERLTAKQIGVLRAWIDQGANWPAEADAAADTRPTHWSLLPLHNSPAPQVKQQQDRVLTPIDAFVIAKLQEKGFKLSPPADKRTLIRRVTFDLTGLPPTPAEVDAFIADDSPQAYERVVDRLLASPRYGERWARHWMDIIHWAETHGHDEDAPRDNAWPYRDYLVRSFNDDKPYAQFVREQVAGDVLMPNDPQGVIATGFLAAGPWDESSQMGIQDGTLDKKMARILDRDDIIMTTMSTFVSSTVHCARCHNHKFDPISQEDYYSLQAVFAGVDRVDRAYDPDPEHGARRRALLAMQADIKAGRVPREILLSVDVQSRVSAWDKEIAEGNVWTVLTPESIESAGGATATPQADGSIVFSGARPDKDTYTITASPRLDRITAVRLEVMTDASLYHNGPGRQDNGNLHLSEFKLFAAPASDPAAMKPVELHRPTADFNQQGWTIEHALDGNPTTAWGIYPEVGKPHFAVFELKTPIDAKDGVVLKIVLEQLHGSVHLIGRPRLSATSAPSIASMTSLTAELTSILKGAPAQRTADQSAALALHVLRDENDKALAALPPVQLVYAVASDFAAKGNFVPAKTPRPVSVLRRGDIRSPIKPAVPGTLGCVEGLESRFKLDDMDDEGARRVALANWLSADENVLTWRSIVNRVWQYHFGRGIVDTPNDFGRNGSLPTHPQLLDWLAVWFRDHGGSLKSLHRLIVTSAAYRQSVTDNEKYAASDADNHYLWRMNRTRLDAEELRDALLAMSGKIDLTMGGPSARQFNTSKGVHVTPNLDYDGFDVDSPAARRRCVYRFIFRTVPDPFMDALDCPDASQLTPKRTTSFTAPQALAMLNDRFLLRYCEHMADRLRREHADLDDQVRTLFELTCARPPTNDEAAAVGAYVKKHGLANACRVILNSNDFMFVN